MTGLDKAIAEYEEWERRVALLIPTPPQDVVRGDFTASLPMLRAEGVAKVTEALMSLPPVGDTPDATPEIRKSSMEDFEAVSDELFATIDRPLQRKPLLEALEARGLVIGGREPLNTLSARMNRKANVINLKGHGFWRRDRPYQPARYVPEPATNPVVEPPFDAVKLLEALAKKRHEAEQNVQAKPEATLEDDDDDDDDGV
jgi:hypothetical protein